MLRGLQHTSRAQLLSITARRGPVVQPVLRTYAHSMDLPEELWALAAYFSCQACPATCVKEMEIIDADGRKSLFDPEL